MNALNFLEYALPSKGLYCVATAVGSGFKHAFFDSLNEAVPFALRRDGSGKTVYMAQATYSERARTAQESNENLTGGKAANPETWKGERTKDNTLYLRSFFIDIDCGAGKPFADQKEGATALKDFITVTGLPAPTVLRSGNGLYAYWIMEEDIPVNQWSFTAQQFKGIVQAAGFAADPAPTANCAVVLRPPQTHNKKENCKSKEVVVINGVEPISFATFSKHIDQLVKKYAVQTKQPTVRPKEDDPWADFQVYQDIPSSAHRIAQKCGQVKNFEVVRGDVDEPVWYAMIGLLRFTIEGNEIIHEWSSGHGGYSVGDTDRKIQQHVQSGTGPTTCDFFEQLCPQLCAGCPSKGKIKSPIILGRPEPVALKQEEEFECQAPAPYTMAEDGLYFKDGDINLKFYDLPLYPVRISYDESLGYETTHLRHKTHHDGWMEFSIRSAYTHDPKQLLTTLTDNHIHMVGKKEKQLMCAYMESYIQRLQRSRRISRLANQMGWVKMNEDELFVLGGKIFRSDGSMETAPLAGNVPDVIKAYHESGELNAWVEATNIFDKDGTEGYAFAFLAGAFGAPLMKFTGYEGAMVCLVGNSGIGKTLMTRFAQSAYGDQNKLMMMRDDTRNSLISRLGIYGSLPLTIDEITNIPAQDLSDLVYRITQGRDKARLNKNSVERATLNHWNTLALVSSNASLVDKLGTLKSDASAEMNRILEFNLVPCEALSREVCTDIFRTISTNYGHAGAVYAKYLIENKNTLAAGIDKISNHIEKSIGGGSEERFWCAVAAATIYGGHIASKLGIINFDIKRILDWTIRALNRMKGERCEVISDAVAVLAEILDEHLPFRLGVSYDSKGVITERVLPRNRLTNRLEYHRNRLYFPRQEMRECIQKRHGSYRKIAAELMEQRILLRTNAVKVLGAGTDYAGGKQDCWEIDTSAPALGNVVASLVQPKGDAARIKAVR